MPDSYDTIVIGAGQGGGPLAGTVAEDGQDVALIERTHVGGTCVNEGCTPTKTMIASARVAHLARRAEDYGVETGEVGHPRAGDHGFGGRAALIYARAAHVLAFDEGHVLAVLGEGAREGPAALASPNDDGVV